MVVGIVVAAAVLLAGLIVLGDRARSRCAQRDGVWMSANEGRDDHCRLPDGSRSNP